MKNYTITKPCNVCKATGKIINGDRRSVNCPYCKGTGSRTVKAAHPSHKMSEWQCETKAPSGTPRFYNVRHCLDCGREEWEHAAGHFLNGLGLPCEKQTADCPAK